MLAGVRKYFIGRKVQRAGNRQPCWLQDPLSHPVLSNMSLVELADLPLGRTRVADCRPTCGSDKPGR